MFSLFFISRIRFAAIGSVSGQECSQRRLMRDGIRSRPHLPRSHQSRHLRVREARQREGDQKHGKIMEEREVLLFQKKKMREILIPLRGEVQAMYNTKT